ncbi:MAG: hypothetical protein ACOYBE_12650 [Blautia sp.]|jgi:hypothetical protein
MKKKIVLLAGLLALCLAFSGCGDKDKKNDDGKNTDQVVDTDTDGEDTGSDNVVSMQKNTDGIDKSKISKFLGTKTATAGEVVITNETGREISEFYLRPTPTADQESDEDYEGDSWGGDLIQGNFTLKDKEQALLYYDKDNKDVSGRQIKNYDMQIAYKDMDASENCFFRNLDLTVTEEIKMQLDDGIPYAKYTNTTTKKEVSTLAAAKKRMGIETDATDSEETPEVSSTPAAQTQEPAETATPAPTEEPDPTAAPPEPAVNPGSKATEYIGKTLDNMISDSDIGSPDASEYDEDPATGSSVGFHYYDGFTVYTIKNDDGSETVKDVY